MQVVLVQVVGLDRLCSDEEGFVPVELEFELDWPVAFKLAAELDSSCEFKPSCASTSA